MSLTLVDKQFLRSVADLVVNRPTLASEFFRDPDISSMKIFDPVRELIVFLSENNGNVSADELLIHINKITDQETKNIFITASSMAKNNN